MRFDSDELRELAKLIAAELRDVRLPPETVEPVYLSTGAIAKRTGTSSEWWRSVAAKGEIPSRRLGRRYLLKWADIEAHLSRTATAVNPLPAPTLPDGDELLARRHGRGEPRRR